MANRCMANRCMANRCMANRCMANRLVANRRVASSETHRKSSADVRRPRSAPRTYRIGLALQNRPHNV
jgi:hypothetical protein